MADARAREQLRQEREAFEQAFRHDKAWFRLRLTMGYLGLGLMLAIFTLAMWILVQPHAYGPVPIGAAAVSIAGQAMAVGYNIVRLVLNQAKVDRLEPHTISEPSNKRSRLPIARAPLCSDDPAAGGN
jgi:hypothetical protein